MIDVKITTKSKSRNGTSGASPASGGGLYTPLQPTDSVPRAMEAEKALEADHAVSADTAKYADKADHAVSATHADKAADLDDDSPVNNRFLSKTHDDTAQGLITFLKGLKVGSGGMGIDGDGAARLAKVVTDILASPDFDISTETGFGFTKRKDGKYQLSITDLMVWGKALFNELEIRRLSYVGGNMVFSACGSKIMRVEETETAYRCYFYQDDGTTATTNLWKVNDQARSQTFNIREGKYQNVSNRSYWRRVTAVGDDYIDLSKTDCEEGSDAPQAEDALVQFGNRTDQDRQNLIYVIVTGDEAPAIIWYDGVNSYTLEKRQTAIISPRKVHFHTKVFRIENYDGTTTPLVADLGAWQEGTEYYLNNRVSHDGRLWLCMVPEGQPCTSEPKEGNDEWLLQVEKGDSPVELHITTDNGMFIRNSQGRITLTATVTRGGEDITAQFQDVDFSWERRSGNPEYDTEWNSRHRGAGNVITVGAEDVFDRSVFDCVLNDI